MSLESTLCKAEQAVDNDDWPTARALVRDAFREAGGGVRGCPFVSGVDGPTNKDGYIMWRRPKSIR